MGSKLIDALVSIAVAVIGVAIIAVIVGKNSNTAGVLSSAGSAFTGILTAATKPVSGSGI